MENIETNYSAERDVPPAIPTSSMVVHDELSVKPISVIHAVGNKNSPSSEQHGDDLFARFVKNYYFPLLKAHKAKFCIIWFCALVLCAFYGPSFLSMTESSLDLPSNTPSVKAINAFKKYYPDASDWPPAIIVQQTQPGVNVINADTRHVADKLADFVNDHSNIMSFVTGYWEYNDMGANILAGECVSESNTTMISSIYFVKDVIQSDISKLVGELLTYTDDLSTANVHVSTTGLFALFSQMQADTEKTMLGGDSIVLPIAIAILGANLQSYRHMVIAILNLICTILVAFAILVPIADNTSINPFAPSIMMSLGIAVCFDYTLFMLNRFKEEKIEKHASLDAAVTDMLVFSGHVVMLSGMILLFTFLLLISFPQGFLKSVGITCSIVIFSALISNLSLTPALLMQFECFSVFELYPTLDTFRSCCSCISRQTQSPVNIMTNTDGSAPNNPNNPEKVHEIEMKTFHPFNFLSTILPGRNKRGIFFHISYWITKHPFILLTIQLMITAPFLWKLTQIQPTSDNALIYIHGSSSFHALEDMQQAFPLGKIDPYTILVTSDMENSVFTADRFIQEHELIGMLLNETSTKYINHDSITAVSYMNGEYISYDTAVSYRDNSTSIYNTDEAEYYRQITNGLVNFDESASSIRIETLIDPNSQGIVGFITHTRKLLNRYIDYLIEHHDNGDDMNAYLFGGYTTTYDLQEIVWSYVPVLVGCTIAAVLVLIFVSFGSIALTLRLAFTVCISLIWAYGFMVIIFEPGPGQDAFSALNPDLKYSSGIYWIIPVMTFSILIGLALDYDIFLMSRMVEYRQMGWSDVASVCLSIEQTGGIITTAGLIMCVSFIGLLAANSIVLNQYGFALFIGVAFDTFIIRTVLMPAIVAAFPNSTWFWYPRKMPPVLLTREQEEKLLLAGYTSPLDAKFDDDDNEQQITKNVNNNYEPIPVVNKTEGGELCVIEEIV